MDPAVERRAKRLFSRDVGDEGLGGVAEVRRLLHDELAARPHEREQPGDECVVAAHPLDGGVGEDDVPLALHLLYRAPLEAQPAAGAFFGAREHLRRRVDAEDVAPRKRVGEAQRQLAGAATEVDGPQPLADVHELDEVLERRVALLLELLVAGWIPGHG